MKSWKSSKYLLLRAATPALILILTSINTEASQRQSAAVEAVLTGDSVRLKGGKILRYIGVESYSPESKIPLERTYGIQAQEFNQTLVGGKTVSVEWDSRLRDKQGRLLGYVYTPEGVFVNREILAKGHGKVRLVAPNLRHAADFRDISFEARKKRLGIWEKEPEDPNKISRYIGEKNTKIYYLPDSPELERIPSAQLVTFPSRVDAKAAGYRACHSCRENTASETEE